MEVERSIPPDKNFLQEVRELCNEKEIILIFDECSSGFRETFGGLHKKYQVEPDIAIFGKTLGNGYAITSVIGKDNIMDAAQKSFISSTFWTERIGPTAALATLDLMERDKTWEYVTKIGQSIKNGWRQIANKYGIEIKISGLDSLACFSTKEQNNLILKTFITQEMLKRGFLASNAIYVSTAHSKENFLKYFNALQSVFEIIAKCEDGDKIDYYLDVPEIKKFFKRLN